MRQPASTAATNGHPPDVPLEVVQSLLTRVIWQAVADPSTPGFRDEAQRFFESETFAHTATSWAGTCGVPATT